MAGKKKLEEIDLDEILLQKWRRAAVLRAPC